jgi:hypothetical protein
VLLSAGCRKLVTPAAVVVAFVVVVTAVVVFAVAVTLAVSCAIAGRLKTSISRSAKTLLITIFFILIDHPLYIQTITRLAERHNTAPTYNGGLSAKQIREQLIKTFFDFFAYNMGHF